MRATSLHKQFCHPSIHHQPRRFRVRNGMPLRSVPSPDFGFLGNPANWGLLMRGIQSSESHGDWPVGYAYAPEAYPSARGKEFVIIRHGHSTWNEQSKIQGNSDQSELTQEGILQSVRCRDALLDVNFDSCFSSPITRARQAAEIICSRRVDITYMDSLQEANLGWFQGLKNEDAARDYPELYSTWRERPEAFSIDGRYPIADVFKQAHIAWREMLRAPGSRHLVVTHKSILRALLCTALGLPPCQFRAFDAANGSISAIRVMKTGQLMVVKVNVQGHLATDQCNFVLPEASIVERKVRAKELQLTASAAAAATATALATNPKLHSTLSHPLTS